MSEEIPKGTKVLYTGSISRFHGQVMEYLGSDPCYSGSGEIKHTLWRGPHRNDGVHNIRRQSFTILEEMNADQG